MTRLHFPKLSRFDRNQEPVSVSIPWAQGQLQDTQHLCLHDGDALLSRQIRSLGCWPDGSIRWSLVHFQPDLPGNAARDFGLSVDSTAVQPVPPAPLAVTHTGAGLRIDTGPLAFTLAAGMPLALRDTHLHGRRLWPESSLGITTLRLDTWPAAMPAIVDTMEVVEEGPLRAVVSLHGRHRSADSPEAMTFHGLVTAFAGKPYVELEHQFIHDGDRSEVNLASLSVCVQPATDTGQEPVAVALGEGYYRTRIERSGTEVGMAIDAETLLYQSNEHFTESFYGDFWVDWRDARSGVAVSLYQAHQHYPKSLHADVQGIEAGLYPAAAVPARILQGMGKTHRLLLHFHDGQLDLDEISTRSLQFQLPDIPSLPRSWYRTHNPWRLDFFPTRVPGQLVTRLNDLHAARPQALGMMHFGDAPDAGYTNQGRGGGESVWVNNEYDRPHMSLLFYALTAQRRMLDSALVCARHWLDVDFCHHHPDPLIRGGLKIHTAYHGTGRVIPSHEWTEGLLDYYFLTGRQEGLEAAEAVGHNIMRHMAQPAMHTPGAAAVREGGWALRAMIGLYLGTGRAGWRQEAERIARMFLAWHDEYGALLAPYTSHTMPRVPFMISITVNSLARYLLLDDDDRIRGLIVDTVDDLLEHTLGPDGITFYKELPSLGRTAPTPHFLEALTHAYHVSGNETYLKIAARQFAAQMDAGTESQPGAKFEDTGGAVIAGQGGGRQFADRYSSLLLFAAAATPLGLLDWYEYPYAEAKIR